MYKEDKETVLPGVGSDAEKSVKPSSRRPRGRGFHKGARGYPKKAGNDFEFWNQYPELMNIATRFPWMHIAGTPLTGNGVATFLPNVLVQHFAPIPGVSSKSTDPINLAFRQLYLDMHRKYRGVGTYQASDIGIAMICIESVLQLIVEAERIYGILKGYPLKSRIEPEGLLLAMGYQPAFISDVKSNLADYRYGINRLIELAKRLPLPQGMSFFKNHTIMNGFVYRDSKDERSALFVFVSDGYYRWTTAGDSDLINKASTATFVRTNRAYWTTYKLMFQAIEAELTKLLTDGDILRITSDFISCYGENNMQVLTPLPEDYRCDAVYSETMLHKLHNSQRYHVFDPDGDFKLTYRALPATTTKIAGGNFAVYQVEDVIYSLPIISLASSNTWANIKGGQEFAVVGATSAYLLDETKCGFINDSWMSEPTQEVVCESVLWKTLMKYETDQVTTTNHCISIEACGTEILTALHVFQVSNGTIAGSADYVSSFSAANSDTFEDGLCHIDWAPLLFLQTGGVINKVIGDVDNVTVVSKDVILKILDAANLSAFKVSISGGGSRE